MKRRAFKPSVSVNPRGCKPFTNERIIRVTFPSGRSCTISLMELGDRANVEFYVADKGVQVVSKQAIPTVIV